MESMMVDSVQRLRASTAARSCTTFGRGVALESAVYYTARLISRNAGPMPGNNKTGGKAAIDGRGGWRQSAIKTPLGRRTDPPYIIRGHSQAPYPVRPSSTSTRAVVASRSYSERWTACHLRRAKLVSERHIANHAMDVSSASIATPRCVPQPMPPHCQAFCSIVPIVAQGIVRMTIANGLFVYGKSAQTLPPTSSNDTRSLGQCDEIRPICSQCQRLGHKCSFQVPTLSPQAIALNEQLFTIDDMQLFHKCLREEPLFDNQDATTAQREQDDFMQLAFAHPYLLHTKLSLAALDLFHHDPSTLKHYKQATAHHLAALRHARPNIAQTSKEHGEAIYIFSALTSLFAFVEPPLRLLSPEHADTVDPISDLLKAFRLGKGIRTIMALSEVHLSAVGKPDLDGTLWPDDRSLIADTVENDYPQLEQLRQLASRHYPSPQAAIIHQAQRDLFESISLLDKTSPRHPSGRLIQTWPMDVDDSILEMLGAGDPVALVMLAHYAVMIHQRRNIWFFQRWPALLLGIIESRLGNEWSEYLHWPRQRIFGK
nr:hypothetical protein CFP56_09587 [Quercus suber]